MTFLITLLKDPDALYDAIRSAVAAEVAKIPISVEVKALQAEYRTDTVYELCRQWFAHGESITVKIDTEAKTCTVLPVQS